MVILGRAATGNGSRREATFPCRPNHLLIRPLTETERAGFGCWPQEQGGTHLRHSGWMVMMLPMDRDKHAIPERVRAQLMALGIPAAQHAPDALAGLFPS